MVGLVAAHDTPSGKSLSVTAWTDSCRCRTLPRAEPLNRASEPHGLQAAAHTPTAHAGRHQLRSRLGGRREWVNEVFSVQLNQWWWMTRAWEWVTSAGTRARLLCNSLSSCGAHVKA